MEMHKRARGMPVVSGREMGEVGEARGVGGQGAEPAGDAQAG